MDSQHLSGLTGWEESEGCVLLGGVLRRAAGSQCPLRASSGVMGRGMKEEPTWVLEAL